MKIQIRSSANGVTNVEVQDVIEIIDILRQPNTEKISFDLMPNQDISRIALYSDGTYQIFGGLVNYPSLER